MSSRLTDPVSKQSWWYLSDNRSCSLTYTHVHIHTHTHVCVHTHIHTHICTHTCILHEYTKRKSHTQKTEAERDRVTKKDTHSKNRDRDIVRDRETEKERLYFMWPFELLRINGTESVLSPGPLPTVWKWGEGSLQFLSWKNIVHLKPKHF